MAPDIIMSRSRARIVCVTGANGYLASHIVARCLAKGYRVNGTVRCNKDDEKTRHLSEMTGAPKGLTLFRAELLAENSSGFQEAVAGCDTVFHTASPHHATVETQDVHAAVFGTLAVLRACEAAGVKTVVMTSDLCASMPEPEPQVRYESQWSDPKLQMKRGDLYSVSKTLSEMAAWRFMEQESPGFRLVTVLPACMVGPSLSSNVGIANLCLFRLMKGGIGETCPNESVSFVDVRDCAEHHIAAMVSESTFGRYFSTAGSWHWNDLCLMMKELSPGMPIAKQCASPCARAIFDISKQNSLGVLVRTTSEILRDVVEYVGISWHQDLVSSSYTPSLSLCSSTWLASAECSVYQSLRHPRNFAAICDILPCDLRRHLRSSTDSLLE